MFVSLADNSGPTESSDLASLPGFQKPFFVSLHFNSCYEDLKCDLLFKVSKNEKRAPILQLQITGCKFAILLCYFEMFDI